MYLAKFPGTSAGKYMYFYFVSDSKLLRHPVRFLSTGFEHKLLVKPVADLLDIYWDQLFEAERN